MADRTPEHAVPPMSSSDELARGLARVLADTYATYVVAQNAHWNVEGPRFYALHGLFEEQYEHLARAVDTIAEHLRALGYYAPATFAELAALTHVRQGRGLRGERPFLDDLLLAHEATVTCLREVLPLTTGDQDVATNDLVIERLRHHEKAIWMLRATLDQKSKRLAA